MREIAAFTVGQAGIVNENHAPAWRAAVTFASVQNAESPRTHARWFGAVICAVVASARFRCQAAPVPDRAAPLRREHSAITGADDGVLIAATSAFRPRTPGYPNPAPCLA